MLWLVTGCSSGIGLSLARAILEAGHQCVASSRNPAKSPEAVKEIEKLGGKWISLDVAGPDVESIISKSIAENGPIDVLVNNAGYAYGGAFEDLTADGARAQFETNVFGPFRCAKAVIPSMRERQSGTIVNISSAEFWGPNPAASIYASSKFALEGWSETIAMELAAFNIRVLLVEPGGTRTSFLDMDNVKGQTQLPEAYKGTITEHVLNALLALNDKQQGDPDRCAKAIVEEVVKPSAEPPLLRLPLGNESLTKMKKKAEDLKAKAEDLKATAEAREKVALATDFPA